jgi:hypothetical protein
MATDRKGPWGHVVALVSQLGDPEKTDFLQLGAAWMNQDKDGNSYLSFELKVEPVQWGNPNCRRIIQVQQVRERQQGNRR